MKLKLEYTAQIRLAAGVSTEEIVLDAPCTLDRLFSHLADRHDRSFREMLLDSTGNLYRSCLVCINNQTILPGAMHSLQDGDTISFVSIIAGG